MPFPDSLTPVTDGIQFSPYYIQADSSHTVTNDIPLGRNAIVVSAVTNNAQDFVVLPLLSTVPVGHKITLLSSVKATVKSRSTEKINNVDSSGTDKFVIEAGNTYTITKMSNTAGWMAFALSSLGAQVAAIVVSSASLSPSASSSASMSPSASLSPSASPSRSQSPSASLSPSASSSASLSPSSSASKSMSPSASLSPSSSASSSSSASLSPSASASSSASASLSPSASPSRSTSPSSSKSPSSSASPSA